MIATTLRRYLESKAATYHVHEHESRITAQEVAQVTHVAGKHFAKGVLLRTTPDGVSHFVLVVVPASEEVDLRKVEQSLGCAVELASESDIARVFPDYQLGSAPPIAELAARPLTVFVDSCLAKGEGIAFRAGSHSDVVEMPWREYARIATHRILDLGRAPASKGPEARAS